MGRKRKPLSLSSKILLGMGLGLAIGLFFGEYCAFLQIIGDAFIKLLQMTILPYIIVSLVAGLGGLTYAQAKLMAKKGGVFLLLFWAISFAMVLLLPLSFPKWETAAFFSASSVQTPENVDFLNLYIPSNPFNSLANNIVPAVVLFCILVGIALMGMEKKEGVIEILDIAAKSLIRITNLVVGLTPIGVFAITAAAAGTMTIQEFGRLQVYLVSFNLGALFLAFWVLPMLLKPLTPFTYRDLMGLTRGALITAFTTGNLFVVLTVLTESCKELFKKYDLQKDKTDTYVDVIIPVSFNFPNTGKLLMLLFVLFAGWFSGSGLSLGQYPTFVFAGLFSFFGGVDVAMPFMLDLMRYPSDLYQLYMVTGIINGRFATLLASMNLVIFTLLTTASLTGVMTLNKRQIATYVVTTILLTFAVVGGMRAYFSIAVQNAYTKDQVIANMQTQVVPMERKVLDSVEAGQREVDLTIPALERIRHSNELRVGFMPDNLPFSYFSEIGELVGLDVDMAQLLARELGVKLVFVPVKNDTMADQLSAGHVDLVMSGVNMNTERLQEITFSIPYMYTTVALIVQDYRRSEFVDLKKIQKLKSLKIGVANSVNYYRPKVVKVLPQAEVVDIPVVRDFFEANSLELDALLMDAEGGSAWTLLYPKFKAVVPREAANKVPLAYPVSNRDRRFADFVSQWIRVKQATLEFQQIYDHWILGKEAEPEYPRWSIMRDVLGWVK